MPSVMMDLTMMVTVRKDMADKECKNYNTAQDNTGQDKTSQDNTAQDKTARKTVKKTSR